MRIVNTAPQAAALSQTSRAQGLALAKLASGHRINSAADNAAGLMISEKLRDQVGGLKQSLDNLEAGVGMIQTAEGGLGQTQMLLQRQRELALQASNTATMDPAQLVALDEQFQALGGAIDTIAQNTQYAGTKLLDGSYQGRSIQSGTSAGDTIQLSIASNATGAPAGFDQAGLGTSGLSLSAPGGAIAALGKIDKALDEVGQQRGSLGALQANTVESTSRSLNETLGNITQSESVIRDTDYAEQTANRARLEILMQTGVAALSQANQHSQQVMRLLGA